MGVAGEQASYAVVVATWYNLLPLKLVISVEAVVAIQLAVLQGCNQLIP